MKKRPAPWFCILYHLPSWHRKKVAKEDPKPIPTPRPLGTTFAVSEITDQLQSPLFSQLSAELRIPIYTAVLGDPERFLHICMNLHNMNNRSMAHWRCSDPESPFPTWQHDCFGELQLFNDSGRCYNVRSRGVTATDDQLLALPLSCRRIYSEAISILYSSNVFHFRGAVSLPAFQNSIPVAQWNAIRKVHVSTAYSPFYFPNGKAGFGKPKTLPNWNQICQDLSTLPNLQALTFDILANDPDFRCQEFEGVRSGPLLATLTPLKAIHCDKMQVEFNIKVPEEVLHSLGPVSYEIKCRDRPSKDGFRGLPLCEDSVELERIHRSRR